MNLTCPSCGAKHSAEAWQNDVKARQALQACCALPAEISKVLLPYMSLFRPEARALSWTKSLKLINDLQALIAQGYIQVKGKPARPCPTYLWARGMEQMSLRTDLSRPMPNHNYLRQIVWQLADQADAGREQHQRQAEVDGSQRTRRPPADPDGMSEIMRKYESMYGGNADAAK